VTRLYIGGIDVNFKNELGKFSKIHWNKTYLFLLASMNDFKINKWLIILYLMMIGLTIVSAITSMKKAAILKNGFIIIFITYRFARFFITPFN
jgi:hypothetical protein